MKNIAVLTSGGDAPGMNAAIRAVVRYGVEKGMRVFGIERGYQGALDNAIIELNARSVSNILQKGGTILKTARCPSFTKVDAQKKAIANMQSHGIEGLVVIGGDGSIKGAKDLTARGFAAVGIPGTIDNDLGYTHYTLGFDTACNTVLEAINKLRDTMESHDRVVIVEVMGRKCGDIALYTGICGGAEVIIVPEMPYNLNSICKKLRDNKAKGKLSGIVMLAEGVGCAHEFADQIGTKTKMNVRSTVLGHMQRGGSPTMRDRFLGTSFGIHAVKLLEKNVGGRIIGIKNDRFFDVDIVEGLLQPKILKRDLYNMAAAISK